MVYEARHSQKLHFLLAGACLLLSILGFAAAGVIPTASGSYPQVGSAIVAACFLAAIIFIRRALDRKVQARADAQGLYARRIGPDSIPWSEIAGVHVIKAGVQRIARFERSGPQARTFGINTTFYDPGIADLLAAIRHYRPELFEEITRL